MDPELKAEWLAALRSGTYPQGTDNLSREYSNGITEYCCLGVLCEIEKGRLTAAGISVDRRPDGFLVVDDAWTTPTSAVCGALGLPENFWFVELQDRQGDYVSLDGLNDNGFTFAQIADVIEWAF